MKKVKRHKRKYDSPEPGEWFIPIRSGYRLCCCDCGLVHKMDFRVYKRRIEVRAWRDNRSTAAQRRKLNVKAKRKN